MALPDRNTLVAGTAINWSASGGGDLALTLTSLADAAAREGVKSGSLVDATQKMPELLEIIFRTAVNAAATNGREVELFIGESDDGTPANENPANLTGADAALSNPDELKNQAYYAGSLILSNARGVNQQKQRFIYYPTCPYIVPLVVNRSGQTLSSTTTQHKITITPYYRNNVD